MAKLKSASERLEAIYKEMTCPAEDGRHAWIFAFACACSRAAIKEQTAYDFIQQRLTRTAQTGEIEHAIRCAYKRAVSITSSVEKFDEFDESALREKANGASKLWTAQFLRGPNMTHGNAVKSSAAFLDAMFSEDETVIVMRARDDRGMKYVRSDSARAEKLATYITNAHDVYYVVNACKQVDGSKSLRSVENASSFRHLMLESDDADAALWIRVLVQLQARVLAIYESGKRSIHAVVKTDAKTLEQHRDIAAFYKRHLCKFGLDKSCGGVVQATRLPFCIRHETKREQRLLWLNVTEKSTAIHRMLVTADAD